MNALPIAKNSGRWSEEECKRFEEAYFQHGPNWKLITRAVGTRTIHQIRSHAQKFIPKLQQRPQHAAKPHEIQNERSEFPRNAAYQLWLYHFIKAFEILTSYNLKQS